MVVKLTVNVPEDVRRRARAVAALRGQTISEVVREALEEYIRKSLEEEEDVALVRVIEARLAKGEERTYSHEEVWREIDEQEARGEL